MKKLLLPLLLILPLVSGCAISRNVTPAHAGATIDRVYVLENDKVRMEGLLPEMLSQIEQLGFPAESYRGNLPPGARFHMTYTANWNWDMAMYLTYFQATLHEDGRVVGQAEYDARRGGSNMKKFGKTSEKIRPLFEEMFQNVQRPRGSSTPMVGTTTQPSGDTPAGANVWSSRAN
jgi:hypothetical protein